MQQIAVMQYKRGPKRLQIIVFPWQSGLAHCALIRIWDQHLRTPHSAWRGVPAVVGQITLALDETTRFVCDAGVEEIMRSPWIVNGAKLEVRQLVDLTDADVVDLKNSRPINDLLKRLHDEVDNWA